MEVQSGPLGDAFEHHVTVLDLVFNTGADAPQYMKFKAVAGAT